MQGRARAIGVGVALGILLAATVVVGGSGTASALSVQKYPSARSGSQMASDPSGNYTLMFSGSNGDIKQNGEVYGDTWEYRSAEWSDLSPPTCTSTTCPLARTDGALAYYAHGTESDMVLFGGTYGGPKNDTPLLEDTWIFNGSWHNITPVPLEPYKNSPPPLHYTKMTWDARDGIALLFGGCVSISCGNGREMTNETWAYEGEPKGFAKWVNLTGSAHAAPPGVVSPGFTFDSKDGYVLLFGGYGAGPKGGATYLNQTWTYTRATGWVDRTVAPSPPPRVWTQMAYYPPDREVVLFAGQESQNKTGNPTLDDTWTYSKGLWTNVTGGLPILPPGRFGGVMAWDPSDNALVLFGGLSATLVGSPVLDDTWWFTGAWSDETT
jgi:hypothetical protein